MIGLLSSLFLLVVGVMALYVISRLIVRPLDQAARTRHCPTQFTIVDVLCLFALVQVATSLIHHLTEVGDPLVGREARIAYFYDAYAWLSIGLIWWKCVRIMSRAGIHKPWHRIVLLIFVLPGTLLSLVLGGFLAVAIPISLAVSVGQVEAWLVWCELGLAIGVLAMIWVCAFVVRRIVAASESVAAAPDDPPPNGGLSPESVEPQ
ncbi:MAG: hypothetical protein GX621_10805 [Pirellulaceae bacterium]|nr:hypothetical protein [Pirellulaceae bacterium]